MFLIIFIKFYTFLTNYLLAYKQHLKRHHFGQDIEFAAKISIKRFFCCPKITKNEFCKIRLYKIEYKSFTIGEQKAPLSKSKGQTSVPTHAEREGFLRNP